MTIQVNANLVRLANYVVGKEFTRYYLEGVRIEPHPDGGVFVVATDGHRLVVAHDPDGHADESAIVKIPKFMLSECKTPKMFGSTRNLLVDVEAQYAKLVEVNTFKDGETQQDDIASAYKVIVDHKDYVDWKRVVPTEVKPAASVGFNPRYLKDLSSLGEDIAKTVKGSQASFIIFTTAETGRGPCLVRFEGVDNIFAVLMPMVVNGVVPFPPFMTKSPD